MDDGWRFGRIKLRMAMLVAAALLCQQYMSLCWCLSDEGMALLKFRERVEIDPFGALSNWIDNGAEMDHCSWFGVECSGGTVEILDLKDLCLWGTLGPHLGKLAYVKSINLRNNSFYGNIPKEVVELKELKVLDLGNNNFSGPFPSDLGNNLSPAILFLDNNEFLGSMPLKPYELKMLSEFQVDQKQLSTAAIEATCNRRLRWNTLQHGIIAERRKMEVVDAQNLPQAKNINSEKSSQSSSGLPSDAPISSISFPPLTSASSLPDSPFSSPVEPPNGNLLIPSSSPILSPSIASPDPANPPTIFSELPPSHSAPLPSHLAPLLPPSSTSRKMVDKSSKLQHHTITVLCGAVGGFILISVSIIGIILCRSTKVVTVKPWVTGLSGQLQKAFVTGVPSLKLSELETACEDFSNIIGSLSDGTVYKGTLSSGVEIAVILSATASPKDWSGNMEIQFREKIDTLSRVNHKNFSNLIGYCEEAEPFKRMMVFEYAPNGTLFEHLHIEEAEHLDWAMRLRVAMGIAYCLDYMHQLSPPLVHGNLQSSCVYLTEDYAAKISDFRFWNKVTAVKRGSATTEPFKSSSAEPESDIYSFGVILFEMITGRSPYSASNGSLIDWACDYLKGEQSLKELVDSSLKFFKEDELEKLVEVMKVCVHPEPKQRPTMKEVTAKLKEITKMGPDGATPKSSPLWWAELEIMSTEVS